MVSHFLQWDVAGGCLPFVLLVPFYWYCWSRFIGIEHRYRPALSATDSWGRKCSGTVHGMVTYLGFGLLSRDFAGCSLL